MKSNLANVKETVKSMKFGKSPRFEKNTKPTYNVPFYIAHSDFTDDNQYGSETLSKSKRFKRLMASEFPGPGMYRVPSFTDKFRLIKEKSELKNSLDYSKRMGMNYTEDQGFSEMKYSLFPINYSGKTTNLPSKELSINVTFDKKK